MAGHLHPPCPALQERGAGSDYAARVRELWVPGQAGPHDDFVERLHRQIERFTERVGADRATVEIELADGARFALAAISPEPGFGFVTIAPHPDDEREAPAELIVPLGSIRRIELDRAEDRRARFGFSLPEPPAGAEARA